MATPTMPRLHGYRERVQRDIHTHIPHLTADQPFRRVFAVEELTTVLIEARASTPHVTLRFEVGDRADVLTVTGPRLLGDGAETTIADLIMIAADAAQTGREMAMQEIVQELLKRRMTAALLQPVIVGVRRHWAMNVCLNDGAEPGPVDVWLTTFATRDVA